ncbi:hypothetical protein HanXRQr2_Chr09g0412721 [Helianthus annuus]|uniref:Uncharacterized protein n=1 Tax=Helianthus annuus TaxID=4232 RepID=A0A9K3NA72_HELAN|nr:hypothetical protein HanXRQr2_Chr09g0412721 [Helianthus annuus]
MLETMLLDTSYLLTLDSYIYRCHLVTISMSTKSTMCHIITLSHLLWFRVQLLF